MKLLLAAVLLVPALYVSAQTPLTTTKPSSWEAAVASWSKPLPCGGWDCPCAFSKKRGCCCVANWMTRFEDHLFERIGRLWSNVSILTGDLNGITAGLNIAFSAILGKLSSCYGPCHKQHADGCIKPSCEFTAPRAGLYSFSFTAFSNEGGVGRRMYHQVSLMHNDDVVASVWEDNREDYEDSGSQTVLLPLSAGDQVYVRLLSGRQLCGDIYLQNSFSGYLIYPSTGNPYTG
ncbi:cerebellin 18 [Polyodon spathula]|uniref:cerebellin 18 n=1 Tax=Polyodon spathula TaxID=7913 RepID=UPI001B7E20E2|nr:cerebellin 18 [Polyodon spathula]